MYKSTNFGDVWFISNNVIGAEGLTFINDLTGFSGGGLNILYKTVNGGFNWYRQRTDSTSLAYISSIDFVNDTVGWYCCAVGRIYKTTTGGEILTDINSNPIELSTENYELYQNYPNPFNSITIINYHLNKTSNVEIEVFNVLGEKVTSLVNKRQTEGVYKETFDSSNLPSGIYFYNLKINNKSVESRRMIILK